MSGCAHDHIGAGVTDQVVGPAVADLPGFLIDVFQQTFPGVKDAAMAGDHVFAGSHFVGAGEGAASQGCGDASEQEKFFQIRDLK